MQSIDPTNTPGKAGRPKGARTATATTRQLKKATQSLFYDVEHLLTEDEKDYYREAYNGDRELDPVIEMQLFTRLLGLYVTTVMSQGLTNQTMFKDFGPIIAQYRGLLSDIESMRVKRQEIKRKYKDDESNEGGVSDFSRKSANDRFESLFGRDSQGPTE